MEDRFRQIVLGELKRAKKRLALCVLATLAMVAAELFKPWPLKALLDSVILNQKHSALLSLIPGWTRDPRKSVLLLALSIVFVTAIGSLFSQIQHRLTSVIGFRVVHAVRAGLFAHVQKLSLHFHHRVGAGDALARLSGDTAALNDLYAGSVFRVVSQLLTLIGMFAVTVWINWRISLVALSTIPALVYTIFRVHRHTMVSITAQRRREGRVASRLSELLSSLHLVQAFGREKHEQERFVAESRQILEESTRLAHLHGSTHRRVEIITAIGLAATIIYGAFDVLNGRMLPGELVLLTSYLRIMYRPMRVLADLSTQLSNALAAQARIREIFAVEPEMEDKPDAIELARVSGEIEFRNVSFGYLDQVTVLEDVSFKIKPGQKLALVGASGAGKTTISNLMLRLFDPQKGAILLDGIDVRDVRRESLRKQTGIVLQNAMLFGATIRENILYGKPTATDEEIVEAAKMADAHDFIVTLEKGYDTVLGQRGATLSGGQQQRIAIARAIVRNPAILVLDEPMSGLDVESESKVKRALDRFMRGRTCLVITHDLAAVRGADQVLVLEHGRIVCGGTHEQLLNDSARYQTLNEAFAQTAAR